MEVRMIMMVVVMVVVEITGRSIEAVIKTETACIVQSESLSLAMFVGLKILASRLVSGSDPDKLLQHN